jgi:hypothetical protein
VLSHWCFYAQQAKQLGVQLPSSPSSCSDAEQQDQQQQLRQGAGFFAGSSSSVHRRSAAAASYAARDDGASGFTAAELSRSWSSQSAALKQQLQDSRRSRSLSLSIELPSSQQQQQQQMRNGMLYAQPARSPASANADVASTAASPRASSQQGSLRSLSAMLSPVLSRTSVKQQQQCQSRVSRAADSGSSSDSEVSARLAPAVSNAGTLSASDAVVAAAWADLAGSKRISGQPSRQSSRSMMLEAEEAAMVAMSPRASQQQQQSPRLSPWGIPAAANTPDAAAAAAVNALPSSSRVSWQQQSVSSPRGSSMPAASDLQDAAALLRRASQQSAANSPKSATWFDNYIAGTAGRSIHQQQQQQQSYPVARSSSRHLNLSTGNLQETLSRQQSLSLGSGSARLPAASAAAGASVPAEVQRSFLGLARAQKLRRRWLLVKVWNRWQQLLQVRNTAVSATARGGVIVASDCCCLVC